MSGVLVVASVGRYLPQNKALRHSRLENRDYHAADLGVSGRKARVYNYLHNPGGRTGTDLCMQSVACQMQMVELSLIQALQTTEVDLPPYLDNEQYRPSFDLRHVISKLSDLLHGLPGACEAPGLSWAVQEIPARGC